MTATAHNASPRAYLRNVLLSYVATFSSLMAGLLVTPILFRRLGSSEFGVYSLVLSIAGIALLADLGVSTTTIRRVADAAARNDPDALAAAVRGSRILLRGSAALTLVALVVVALVTPAAFDLHGHLARDAQVALLIVAAGQTVLVAAGTTTSVVIGHGRADLFAVRSTVLGLTTAVAQAVAALAGTGIVGVSTVVALSSVLSAAVGLRLQRRVLGTRIARAAVPRGQLLDTLREGSVNLGIAVFGTIAFASDAVVLGALAPLTAVAAYAVATRVPGLIRTISSRAVDLLTPTISHFNAADPSVLLGVLSRATRLTTAMGIVAALAISPNLRWLFHLWLGATPSKAVEVAILLTVAMVLQMPTQALIVFLTGLRKLGRMFWFVAASAIVNVGLSIVLTPHLGATGPAWASAACVVVGDMLVVPFVAAPAIGVSARTILSRTTAPAVLPAIPATAAVLLLDTLPGVLWSVIAGLAGVVTYLAMFWMAAGDVDRTWVRGLLSRQGTRRAEAAR